MKPHRRLLIKFGATLATVGIVVAISFFAIKYRQPPTGRTGKLIPAGEIVQQFGTHLSPHGKSFAHVQTVSANRVSVKVAANNDREVPSSEMKFDVAEGWFATWDEKDRFWIYIPGHGVHRHTGADENEVGVTMAGEFGGWDGIPLPFLERLPPSQKQKYEQSLNQGQKGPIDPV